MAAIAAAIVGNIPRSLPLAMAVKPVEDSMTTPIVVPLLSVTVQLFGLVIAVAVMPPLSGARAIP